MTIPAPAATTSGSVAGARAAQLLSAQIPDAVVERRQGFGEETVVLDRGRLVEVATLLRDHPDGQYTMPVFVTAVDHLDSDAEAGPEAIRGRFEIVYQLRSLRFNDICRLVVWVEEDAPAVPSLERIFAGMDWHERECFDLFGIEFTGHHDLRRILMPDDWEGHPLRKDYVSFAEPIAFSHNLEWALPMQERPPDMPGSTR